MYDRKVSAEILGDLHHEMKYKTGKNLPLKSYLQIFRKKYGLSDKALARIEIMNHTQQKPFEMPLIDTFNALIESDEFGAFIDNLAKCRHND